MKTLSWKLKAAITALCMFMFAVALLLPERAAAQDCAAIQAWVKANADHLPTTYEAFNRHSMGYRKAIFKALSPAQKSALWRQQLRHYLATRPNLTPQQTEVIQSAIEIASPELFQLPEDAATTAAAWLRDNALAVFNAEEAELIFATLGAPDGSGPAPASPLCVCSTKDDWCGSSNHCQSGGCLWQASGCGFLGLYACNGMCYPNT